MLGHALPGLPFSADDFVIERARAADFQPHLNTVFTVNGAPLRLVRVTERPTQHGVEQFSIVFQGATGSSLEQGIHTLRHPTLGRFDLFIAAIGAPAGVVTYEACFSRHLTAPAFAPPRFAGATREERPWPINS